MRPVDFVVSSGSRLWLSNHRAGSRAVLGGRVAPLCRPAFELRILDVDKLDADVRRRVERAHAGNWAVPVGYVFDRRAGGPRRVGAGIAAAVLGTPVVAAATVDLVAFGFFAVVAGGTGVGLARRHSGPFRESDLARLAAATRVVDLDRAWRAVGERLPDGPLYKGGAGSPVERVDALVAAAVRRADAIGRTTVWPTRYLATHRARFDPRTEATAIAEGAVALRGPVERLGAMPEGTSPAAQAAQRAHLLARQPLEAVWTALVARATALSDYLASLQDLDRELAHSESARRALAVDDDARALLAGAVGSEFAAAHLRDLDDHARGVRRALDDILVRLDGDLQTLIALGVHEPGQAIAAPVVPEIALSHAPPARGHGAQGHGAQGHGAQGHELQGHEVQGHGIPAHGIPGHAAIPRPDAPRVPASDTRRPGPPPHR